MKQHSSHGFSLVEVVVAMTILGVSAAVVFSGLSVSLRGIHRVDEQERRIQFARQKLAETELLENFQAGDTARGMFNEGTRWRLDTSYFIPPVTEGGPANPNSMIRLTLTMEWESGGKPKSFAIETYRFAPPPNRPPPRLESQLDAIH